MKPSPVFDPKPAIDALTLVLHNLPPKLVAIDGRVLAGKSTLARYLAGRFNVSLIEGDLFLRPGLGHIEHRLPEIERILEFRLGQGNPIFIESVIMLKLLAGVKRSPDFLIYVQNAQVRTSSLDAEIRAYEREFRPRERADLILPLDV